MTEQQKLQLWRLVADLSVVDAAILIAGGDPSAVDREEIFNGNLVDVKRTTGHDGFQAAFAALTRAIRKGDLPAFFTARDEMSGVVSDRLPNENWILSATEVARFREIASNDPFRNLRLNKENNDGVEFEPDWSRTTIDAEELKAWLRSCGFASGFFFPPEQEHEAAPDDFMDPAHERYSPHLALAVSAWRGLEGAKLNRGVKNAIDQWITSNPDAWKSSTPLSKNSKDEIIKVVNWRKEGGPPKTGG